MTSVTEIAWTDEQKIALSTVKAWIASNAGLKAGSMLSLQGVAGSGKTTAMGELKKSLPTSTMWTAMTGKAALRLSGAAGVPATTLHSQLYKRPVGSGKNLYFSGIKEPAGDFLVVDESSMTSPKIYEDLHEWTKKGVKILFVGDGVQLPPILSFKEEKEYGDDFIVFKKVPGPALTKVMRSGDGVIEIVSSVRENKRFPTKGNDSVKIQEVSYPGITAIKDYLDDPEDHFLITWTNKMRMQGNIEIRRKLGHTDKFPSKTEPVLICKNGKGRLNGEIVFAERFEPGPTIGTLKTWWMYIAGAGEGEEILVSASGKDQWMDGSLPEIKDWSAFHRERNKLGMEEPIPITYGYVLTAHKAQGSEARRITVYLSGNDLNNQHFGKMTTLPSGEKMPFAIRWAYTSFSRAKDRLGFYYSR